MKKLLLIFLITATSFGQEKVLETADFYGYDFKGNYIEKIERVEKVSSNYKYITWKGFETKKALEGYNSRLMPYTSPYNLPYHASDNLKVNLKDEHLCSYAENYKYFTSYEFYGNDITIDYGYRLLKPSSKNKWKGSWDFVNMLYYKKNVKIADDKTVIENQYSVAVKEDSLNKMYSWLQLDPANYYLTVGSETDPNALKKGTSLKDQIKQYIWINIDDNINYIHGDEFCFDDISQNVYDKNHIITLNNDFDYTQLIESPRQQMNPKRILFEDHIYVFTFGLEDPSKNIDDFDVENGIEYRVTYFSRNTQARHFVNSEYAGLPGNYQNRRAGSYKLEIKKKINGVFYFDKVIYSDERWDYSDDSNRDKIFLYDMGYGQQRGQGQLKFFRSSGNIYFALNNNLLDTTKDHYFENNTLLLRSYFKNIRSTRWDFRPFFNQITYDEPHIKISKTINKRLPLSKDSFKSNSNNWAGNGSGIIISKLGHIVTNHHVIKDANDIEVEFILNNENKKFKAEVVQVDKINDLAVLRIVDDRFQGVTSLPYNFKSRSSDVGTKIYTFGYPKALTGMGKEIKVTEGIISSKSGYNGDITKYQITAPIQGGNSGGPLFDDKGNFIGINSSKFNSDETENVNYSIKSSYVMNLIDVLPKSIDLPSSSKLQSLPLTEQIKEISKYVVLVKVK